VVLLDSTSYFFKDILNNPKCRFFTNLMAIAIDEAHVVRSWGDFREKYWQLNLFRDFLPNIPVMITSATLTPDTIRYIIKAVKLQNPVIVQQSICRINLGLWVLPVLEPGLNELEMLIPKIEPSETAEKIPKTLVFLDNTLRVNEITRFLRQLLPEHLRQDADRIIRAYHGPIDAPTKAASYELVKGGIARIVLSTDAFGLGVDVRDVTRVVLWEINSALYIDSLFQRIGRGGRDHSLTALAVAFASETRLL
jgi:ATP-dependent DNA helicase RecQ